VKINLNTISSVISFYFSPAMAFQSAQTGHKIIVCFYLQALN